MAHLSPYPKFRAFDTNGLPLVGGQLFSYQAGTSTPQATFTDESGAAPNTNPVILDAYGEANVWLDDSKTYKLVLQDADGETLWTVDNIASINDFSITLDKLQDGILANSTDGRKKMEDGYLSATADGLAKMEDGYLQSTTAGRRKMANGFLSATADGLAKMADGFLQATTAGLAKMADGFLQANAGGLAKMADGFFQLTDPALAKFADGFWTASTTARAKFANGFVNTVLILDAAVTTAKINDGAVTPVKVGGFYRFIVNALSYTNSTTTFTSIASLSTTLPSRDKLFYLGAAEGMPGGTVGSISSTAAFEIEIMFAGSSIYRQSFPAGTIGPIVVLGGNGFSGAGTIAINGRVTAAGTLSITNCQFKVTQCPA